MLHLSCTHRTTTITYSLSTTGFLTIRSFLLCNNHFKLEASWMQKATLVAVGGGRCCADFDLMPKRALSVSHFLCRFIPVQERQARKYP
jgi:hypothetical protein